MKRAKLLSKMEMKRVLAVVRSSRHAARNELIVALSFLAGLRACEIAALRVGDVYGRDGEVADAIILDPDQTKGHERQTVLVSTNLRKKLAVYRLKCRGRTWCAPEPLVRSAKRGAFSAASIANLFAHIYKLAGISGASSHSCRRQFITSLADSGVSAHIIQALARHKNLSTTQRYIEVNEAKMRNAVELVSIAPM
jgi:integrase/recombinase XerD